MLHFDCFLAHLLHTLVCFEVHSVPRIGSRQRCSDSLHIFLYIDRVVSVSCSGYYILAGYVLVLINS